MKSPLYAEVLVHKYNMKSPLYAEVLVHKYICTWLLLKWKINITCTSAKEVLLHL